MSRLRRLLLVVRTLGFGWLMFRVVYALKMRLGWFVFRCPQKDWSYWSAERVLSDDVSGYPAADWIRERLLAPDRMFPETDWAEASRTSAIHEADEILAGRFSFYSCDRREIGFPPQWNVNPVSGENVASDVHWSRLSDFAFGDIKHIWETARFGSGIVLGRAYRLTNDEQYADAFWNLVEDSCEKNPPNAGVHWKCGQETALRLLSLLFAAGLVRDAAATTESRLQLLLQLSAVSAERIAANLGYAESQKNNHGISEAVGLYVVGLLFPQLRIAARSIGLRSLESQIAELMDADGAFSSAFIELSAADIAGSVAGDVVRS